MTIYIFHELFLSDFILKKYIILSNLNLAYIHNNKGDNIVDDITKIQLH